MEHLDACAQTRNYGCRIRQYIYQGIAMLSLENQKIKVVFALGKGADIVEFLYKPTDIDFMWHSFNELNNVNHVQTIPAAEGSFLDTYVGGWQELCPTYGSRAMYCGGSIGAHGEACLYPWDAQILQDTREYVEVKLTLRTTRSPFLLEKTVGLQENEARLALHQKITNLGSVTQDFMWAHHPAFGVPFLDDSVRLHLKGTPRVTVPEATIAHRCPFAKETTGVWPTLPGRDGRAVDMSRAYAPNDKLYMEYFISELAEGRYELVNHHMGLGMRMSWDPSVFRYLWVWGLYCGIEEYPWYGRAYVMAVEPWSSMPADFETAQKNGTVLHLAANAWKETDFTAEVFQQEDR